jgi:hypothetical protein
MKLLIFAVTEIDVEVIKKFKGKHSAGIDEIPNYVVKKSIKAIKKPLAHICNASQEFGIFPDSFNIAKVKPLYKRGIKITCRIIDQYPFMCFLKSLKK